MDRASDSGSEGWGFESLLAYQVQNPLKSLQLHGFGGFSFYFLRIVVVQTMTLKCILCGAFVVKLLSKNLARTTWQF